MSAEGQIGRLQSLLSRIKRNAALPRAASAPLVAAPAPVAAPSPVAAPAPVAAPSAALTPAPAPFEEEVPVSEDLLLDDEIVDITEAEVIEEPAAAAPPPAARDELDFSDLDRDEEEPPVSSRRSKVASSMIEALAGASEDLEADLEAPLKTPPPESGRQITAAPAAALGSEPPLRPTTEQLGQTIDLDDSVSDATLELDEPLSEVTAARAPEPEELEIVLPSRASSGAYSLDLTPPPEAHEDLERHRQRAAERSAPSAAAEVVAAPPPPPVASELRPEVYARPNLSSDARPSEFVVAAQSFAPATFAELLDASLELGSG
ncbi:MAG: hypothetical protein OZ921_11795 [Sorangiineae bacterium]|nr:hypothetical protein [Sorangiineae bacterium]